MNNAVHWQAVEHVLLDGPDPRLPLRARLDYREPIDLGDDVRLDVSRGGGEARIALRVDGQARAVASVARIEPQ